MIDIGNLIDYLNTKTEVTDLVGNRIFYGLPNTDQTENYVTINVISNIKKTVESKTRIEVRAIGGNNETNFSTLYSIIENINLVLQDYNNAYKILEDNTYNSFDEKNRKIFIQDLKFQATY